MTLKRFYKDKVYIGVRDHQKDSWGGWEDITTVKLFLGKPDSLYRDEMYEYTDARWYALVARVKSEAASKNREFVSIDRMATTYPIWQS